MSEDPFLTPTEAARLYFLVWTPSLHQRWIMLSLSIVSFMVALDACIIITSINAISIDLKLSTTQGIWIGTAYLLVTAITMPFIAQLSNAFGRPAILTSCLSFFTVGSILCCLADGISLLLAGRILQGLGGAGVMVLSLVIFTDIVPLRHRPKWYGLVLGAWALGNCLGPVIGGIIAQKTTWRWIFYIMFPFCAAGLILIVNLLTLKAPRATLHQKLESIDWVGGLLFIPSGTSFLIAVSWGGVQFSWSSSRTLVPLCLGIFGFAATFFYESKFPKRPFLQRSLFQSTSPRITYLCGTIQGFVIYGQLYYVPFYFLSVKLYDPIHTGLALLPVMVTLVPASMLAGLLVTLTANYRRPIWIGWALTTLGSGLTLLFHDKTPVALWVIVLIILGLGHGAVLNAQNFAAQAMSDEGEQGDAAAMYAFVRQFGMSLGVGVGGCVFQNVMALRLERAGLDTAIAKVSEAFVAELHQMPVDSPFRSQVIDAYSFGLKGIYLVFTSISGLALLLSTFMEHRNMAEQVISEHELQEIFKGGH
ncbi:major facilitator superfamily transporter [Diaporthe sp. PMI_573]|nr:major facilitator superfamily transporter [Diaporthaceae sp. PMI_573]